MQPQISIPYVRLVLSIDTVAQFAIIDKQEEVVSVWVSDIGPRDGKRSLVDDCEWRAQD